MNEADSAMDNLAESVIDEVLCDMVKERREEVVRARRLSVLGQPNTTRARVLGWISVPALIGMQMVMLGRTSDRVYQWRSASVTLDDGSRTRIRPMLWLTGVIGGVAAQTVILLLPILVISGAARQGRADVAGYPGDP